MSAEGVISEQNGGSPVGRARKQQILRVSAEVVADLGYASASVSRIAERAGISKGVITYHFASKDQILRTVADRLFDRCKQHIEARADKGLSLTEQIRLRIGSELEFFASHRTEFIAMSEIMANHRDPDFSHAFEAQATSEIEQLIELLTQGHRDGEFRSFNVRHVAGLIHHCKNGVLDSWAQDPGLDLGAHAESLLEFIEVAIIQQLDPIGLRETDGA